MSISVFVYKPGAADDDPDRLFIRPAGYEGYQSSLWGSQSIIRRSRLLPRIHHGLEVLPKDFDSFEQQCRLIDQEAEEIASELEASSSFAAQIRGYMKNFLDAVAFARMHGSDSIDIS
jgi:hypothetical protein